MILPKPICSARLRAALYIPDSHKHLNLIAYLQNYMQQLSSKYPFWNRTSGADHFLAGCHDWATHETEHSMKTAVRALCTSDARRGFEIGKDVALRATKIYHVRVSSTSHRRQPTPSTYHSCLLRRGNAWIPPSNSHQILGEQGSGHAHLRTYTKHSRINYFRCKKQPANSDKPISTLHEEQQVLPLS